MNFKLPFLCALNVADDARAVKRVPIHADLAGGRIESEGTRNEERRQTLAWMDQIRLELEVRYPFEEGAKL